MHYLSVENLSKQHAENILFRDLSLGLEKGDKIALVARNGAGKSTLMRIVAGIEEADEGQISIRDGLRLALLPQEPDFFEDQTIRELINGHNNSLLSVIKAYTAAMEKHAEKHNKETELQLAEATSKMDLLQAWDYERRLSALLQRFNISDLDQNVVSLSGGQKKRLSLALTLLDNPDVLLLDEPTNHLDIDMIEWLEKHLSQSAVTFIMVTHDRYFLDRVCNQILELNRGSLQRYSGNYSRFLEQRVIREEVLKTEVDKARKLMKKELDWIQRMPKARTTKSKARIDSFEQTKDKAYSLPSEKELKLKISHSRIGGKILEMSKVTKSYGDKLMVSDFTYTFKKGDRIGIVGQNGIGKSTFLNLITGKVIPERGEVSPGETIKFGYYRQEGLNARDDQRVLDVVTEIAEFFHVSKSVTLTASQFLHHFLFDAEMQNQTVSTLSGGEKRRLYLLTILIQNPNFLILEEPTNDLDIVTLSKLEEFLSDYTGCLLLVSHDRYFLDHTIDQLFVFEGEGQINHFPGNYSIYHESKIKQGQLEKSTESVAKMKSQVAKTEKPLPTKKKLTYAELKEYDAIEMEIGELEEEKKTLEEKLNSGELAFTELQEVSGRMAAIIDTIENKMLRWMELEDLK